MFYSEKKYLSIDLPVFQLNLNGPIALIPGISDMLRGLPFKNIFFQKGYFFIEFSLLFKLIIGPTALAETVL